VTSGAELRSELAKAYSIATSGRMGPVLVDVPMDVQQAEIDGDILLPSIIADVTEPPSKVISELNQTLAGAKRPVVLWGAGIGLAGVEHEVAEWLRQARLPFVSSWAGLSFFDHDHPGFVGQVGVYGNRGANFVLQNADAVIVLGSRLDNRQRSGNAANFAIGANVHVVDIDKEELAKYRGDGYRVSHLDFANLPEVLRGLKPPAANNEWTAYVAEMKERYYLKEASTSAARQNSLSPYDVVRRISDIVDDDAIVIGDTGAAVCWLYQGFRVKKHTLFNPGGNSPMGYSLPAAIGAKLDRPDRQVISYNGDGGFHVNIQELHTAKHNNLDIAFVVMNNGSYGIIKQFQDSYMQSRYTASRDGLSLPDFGALAAAYGLRYARIDRLDQLEPGLFTGGPIVIDVILSEHTLIEPKLEMGRPINDQFPYLSDDDYAIGNRFVDYPRPASMRRP
jgi:acetolactate synthase-1/2/3 large subunit